MKKLTILTIVVLAVVIALPIVGLVLRSSSEFIGADMGGENAITELDPDYTPWFDLLWTQTDNINWIMFAVQGVVGGAVFFCAMGYLVGRARGRAEGPGEHPPVSARVITTYVVIGIAALAVVPLLYYVVGYRPPSGEIIAMFYALEGVIASGLLFFGLGFFFGRGKGRTQAAQACSQETAAGTSHPAASS